MKITRMQLIFDLCPTLLPLLLHLLTHNHLCCPAVPCHLAAQSALPTPAHHAAAAAKSSKISLPKLPAAGGDLAALPPCRTTACRQVATTTHTEPSFYGQRR